MLVLDGFARAGGDAWPLLSELQGEEAGLAVCFRCWPGVGKGEYLSWCDRNQVNIGYQCAHRSLVHATGGPNPPSIYR